MCFPDKIKFIWAFQILFQGTLLLNAESLLGEDSYFEGPSLGPQNLQSFSVSGLIYLLSFGAPCEGPVALLVSSSPAIPLVILLSSPRLHHVNHLCTSFPASLTCQSAEPARVIVLGLYSDRPGSLNSFKEKSLICVFSLLCKYSIFNVTANSSGGMLICQQNSLVLLVLQFMYNVFFTCGYHPSELFSLIAAFSS